MSTHAEVGLAPVTYRIDGDDTLVSAGGAWSTFAEANGGFSPDPLGASLWSSIVGEDVRAIWRLLLQRVRRTDELAVFVYRCDAPDTRRLLQMELVPGSDGAVEFRSQPVREDTRVRVSLIDPRATRSDDVVTVCGWCARVRLGDWIEPEEAVDRLGLLAGDLQPRLTHGICDACAADMRALALAG